MQRLLILFFYLCYVSGIFAQDFDRQQTYVLDSVVLTDLKSPKKFRSYSVYVLKDSLSSTQSIVSLLQKHTAVFIKEYGKGMLSSLLLRGTNASHTQVVWNGIAVNSILNGQTDLNTFSPSGFDEMFLKKGGSSVAYGSGAIGGIVVFNDRIFFKKNFQLLNQIKIGSFKTAVNAFKILNVNARIYTKFNFQIQKSQNDYPYIGYQNKNENAVYQNTDLNFTAGYKTGKDQMLYFKSKFSYQDRETPGTLYMPQDAKLLTQNQYLLSGWQTKFKTAKITTEVAYLFEKYNYFFNKNSDVNSQSLSRSLIVKNQINWLVNKKSSLLISNEWSRQEGKGDNINQHLRQNYALYAVWYQNLKRFEYHLKLRKDFNPDTKIPLTGAIELLYSINQTHQLRFNTSKNFRLPTFNDLYWQPGGNPDLKPEESSSFEVGYDWRKKNFKFHLTGFYIDTNNLIKWVPGSNQLWQPENFEKVVYKGFESSFYQHINIGNHFIINNHLDVTWQQAINQNKNKQVPFTPQLLGLDELQLKYKSYALTYRYQYQGKIYTTTTNTNFLPSYHLHGVSLDFQYNEHLSTRFNINNLLNTYYENVPTRPQPGRYYEFILNFKI